MQTSEVVKGIDDSLNRAPERDRQELNPDRCHSGSVKYKGITIDTGNLQKCMLGLIMAAVSDQI